MGYEYAVTTSATPPVSGTATTNTFAVLTGLSPQTLYYVHVRAMCGVGSYGNWASTSFTTACVAISSLPWIENFDAITTPAIPNCWFKETGNYTTSIASIYNTAYSGANYLRVQYGANNAYIWTPGFNLVAGTSYDFSSFIQGDNGDDWTVNYYVNNNQLSTGATQLGATYAVPGTGSPYAPQTYNKIVRSFVPTTTGTYYFAVKVNEPSFAPWYLAFDDFELKLSPACATPTPLASAITATTATLSWTAISSALVGYEYVLNTVATDPTGAGTSITGTSYSATALTGSTTYYFHIRSVCSVGTTSTWSTVSFTTGCVAQNVPYSQNFESATTPNLPSCTTVENVGTGNLWKTVNSPGNGFTSKTLSYSYNFTNAANVWFYTNGINLTAGTAYKISYDYGTSLGSVYTEKLKVAYGTSASAASMTNVLADYTAVVNEAPISDVVNFTPSTSGVYYFGFNAKSDANEDNLYVDNILVDVALANNSFTNNSLSVYPNPVKNILNINYTENITKIQVVNMLGQEVISKLVNNTQNQIDMSQLVQGTYLVKITSNDLVKTMKVIKE